MLSAIAKKVFGSRNERVVRRMRRSVERINALEDELQALNDAALAGKTT